MQVVENEKVVCIDIDGTLITPDTTGSLLIPYGSVIKSYSPIMAHVDLLKHYHGRGFYIVVWSHGGVQHALYAVKALKLERFVDIVITKPMKHVDDKENVEDIVGSRVFLT